MPQELENPRLMTCWVVNLPEQLTTQNDNGLSIEEVIEESKQFYLAGQETTSSWLTWTIIVLAMHPDWQEKAREEVLQVCGKKEPNFEATTRFRIVSSPPNHLLHKLIKAIQTII